MKKILTTIVLVLILSAGKTFAQQTSQWSDSDRVQFVRECVQTAKAGMSEDSAKYYCHCMMSKLEVKYPDPKQTLGITEADLNSPEWQKMIASCRNGWSSKDRIDFVSNCVSSAVTGGMDKATASSYCDCMQVKMELRYPDPKMAADSITTEKIKSPEFVKLMQGCLNKF